MTTSTNCFMTGELTYTQLSEGGVEVTNRSGEKLGVCPKVDIAVDVGQDLATCSHVHRFKTATYSDVEPIPLVIYGDFI